VAPHKSFIAEYTISQESKCWTSKLISLLIQCGACLRTVKATAITTCQENKGN